MKILDNINNTVLDDLRVEIKRGSRVVSVHFYISDLYKRKG